MYNKPQRLLAEFIGTFAVVLFSAGAVCADQSLRTTVHGGAGLLGDALAYGFAVGVLMTSLGHISGGHFNPAITIGFWVTRKLSTFDTLAYWAVQLLGAMAAAYLLRRLPFDAWATVQLGTPELAGVTRATGMIFEAVLTFFVVLVVFATAVDRKGMLDKLAGLATGLTVTLGVLLGGPFTGAALNPARAFGPALAANHWANQGVYWVGPLAGGVVAGWLYDTVFLAEK